MAVGTATLEVLRMTPATMVVAATSQPPQEISGKMLVAEATPSPGPRKPWKTGYEEGLPEIRGAEW